MHSATPDHRSSNREAPPLTLQQHLAMRLYRDLINAPETSERLADGEEPGELFEELADRALNMAAAFTLASQRQHQNSLPPPATTTLRRRAAAR